MPYRAIASLAVDMQVLHLLGSTLPSKKKKKKVGKMAVEVLVGLPLLRTSASMVTKL